MPSKRAPKRKQGLMDSVEEQGNIELGMRSIIFQKIAQSSYKSAVKREYEIHNTDLVYDCLRRPLLRKTFLMPSRDLESLLRTWIGTQVHDFPILEHHELELVWEGIFTSIDEYEDGFFLEKKTCRETPVQPKRHHITQTEYGSVILSESGYPVVKVGVMYINVAIPEIKILPVLFKRKFPVIKSEMIQRRDRLLKGMRKKKIPPRRVRWICNYCEWANYCFLDDQTLSTLLGRIQV